MKLAGKYYRVFAHNLQNAFISRAEGLVWFVCDTLPFITFMFFWLAAYEGRQLIGQYTFEAMLVYYLGMASIQVLLVPHPEGSLSYYIRYGTFSNFLLRPVSCMGFDLMDQLAWKVVRIFYLVPALLLFIMLVDVPLQQTIAWQLLPYFTLACLLSFLIQYCLRFAIGTAAFWIVEVDAVSQGFGLLGSIFSGQLIPFDLLPAAIQQVGDYLPFKYLFYFPMQILLGNISYSQIWTSFLMQFFWLAISFAFARKLLSLGIRRYEAVGG